MKINKKILIITSILLVIFFIIFYFFSWQLKEIPPKNKDNYRIVNYNLKYADDSSSEFEGRKKLMVEQLLSYDADIITLQEANYGWMNSIDGLPILLKDYSYVGVGREDGNTKGEYAPIFYLTDRFEVIDNNTIWLSETPNEVSIGWDSSTYRIMTSATLKNKETEEILVVNNTHLDHVGKKSVSNSIDLILKTISTSKYPYFLTGDMNIPSFYPSYLLITNKLNDTKNSAKDSMKHGTINYNSTNKLLHFIRIDYIFTSKNDFNILTYRVDPSYKYLEKPLSDHFPVIVDFTLKN